MRSGDQRVVEKIRKLLALARSSNEHEAALAATRAAELMLEHKLDGILVDAERAESIQEWILEHGRGSRLIWKGLLANAAAETFGCRFYFQHAHLAIIGFESQREAVETTYRYLVELVSRMAEAHKPPPAVFDLNITGVDFVSAEDAMRSYRIGVARAINDRLKGLRRRQVAHARLASDTRGVALAVVDREQEAVDRYLDRMNLATTVRASQVHRDSEAAGARDGSRVNFQAPGLAAGGAKLIK